MKEQKPKNILTTTHYSREYMKNWLLCKDCSDLKLNTARTCTQLTESRKFLSALTLSRLLPYFTYSSFFSFLKSSYFPSSCFSTHSKFQHHTTELRIIENKADRRFLPFFSSFHPNLYEKERDEECDYM